MHRVVIHSDLNCFFASVECLKKPWLRNVPMAVAGDSEMRHGIILAKNFPASHFGVSTGEPIWSAKKKCPEIVLVPPDYEDYYVVSQRVREIYSEYSNKVEAFGIDECWLDVTDIANDFEAGRQIADEIREKIKNNIHITASCGVSFNKIFAKLGSDIKKYDATTVITDKDFKEKIWKLPCDSLLFVGRSTQKALAAMNIYTIGDIARCNMKNLEMCLGKNGTMLWNYANGYDLSPVKSISASPCIKSVSQSVTLPKDITDEHDVKIVLYQLCEKISSRMRKIGMLCNTVHLYVRDFRLNSYERQRHLNIPCRDVYSLFDNVFRLYKENNANHIPIRSLGVRASDLCTQDNCQISLSEDFESLVRKENLDTVADNIREKYGNIAIQRGIMIGDNINKFAYNDKIHQSFANISV